MNANFIMYVRSVDTSTMLEPSEEVEDSIAEILPCSKDEFGREHVIYPHTGPSIVYLRNNFFHENTCLEHKMIFSQYVAQVN